MSEDLPSPPHDLLHFTAQIVSAHVAQNAVPPEALPALIRSVHAALAGVEQPAASEQPERPQPAVPIRRSVFPDYIVCLEDGAKMTMLKRYLKVRFDLTPEAYRERWGLPRDYPMVAPSYAERRSTLAKSIGLGRKKEPEPEPVPAPKKRGRSAKAQSGVGAAAPETDSAKA